MIQHWTRLYEKVNEKNMRERLIIALLLFAVIYALGDFLLLTPKQQSYEKLVNRMDTLRKEMVQLNAQETVFAEALTNDPNALKKKELEMLEKRLLQLDDTLEELSIGLIRAEKLPKALQAVLGSVDTLTLVGMQTHAPKRLLVRDGELSDGSDENNAENKSTNIGLQQAKELDTGYTNVDEDTNADKTGVFKHTVTVEIEGKYFDVVNYLKALEALPWKIYWEEIDYQVKQYPTSRVSIEVYTLSTDEGVLGV